MKATLKVLTLITFLFQCKFDSNAQIHKPSILVDSVEIIKFIEYVGNGKNVQIISYDQYFIYNDNLYNNPMATDLDVCSISYSNSDQLRRVTRFIDSSNFYKILLNSNSQKRIPVKDFTNAHVGLLGLDTLGLLSGKILDSNLVILSKKEPILFFIFECTAINKDQLAGGGTHNKFLEKYLFPLWNGKFLMPIMSTKSK